MRLALALPTEEEDREDRKGPPGGERGRCAAAEAGGEE